MMTISRHNFMKIIIVLVLQWKQGCYSSHVEVNAQYGNITTPNYPKYVSTNNEELFSWTITVDMGHRIRLQIKDLILVNCPDSCNRDYFDVYDLVSQSYLIRLCSGIASPTVYYSSGNKVDVMLNLFNNNGDPSAGSNRRLWIYFETFPLSTTSKVQPTPANTITPTPTKKSGKLSATESTILVVGIIVSVFLSVIIIFICGLKRRCSRRQRETASDTLASIHEAFEIQIPEPPPSYDEATRSSQTSLPNLPNYSPPRNPLCVHDSDSPTSVTAPQANGNVYSTEHLAYDATGLPSYSEAHRLSQASLNRDDNSTVL